MKLLSRIIFTFLLPLLSLTYSCDELAGMLGEENPPIEETPPVEDTPPVNDTTAKPTIPPSVGEPSVGDTITQTQVPIKFILDIPNGNSELPVSLYAVEHSVPPFLLINGSELNEINENWPNNLVSFFSYFPANSSLISGSLVFENGGLYGTINRADGEHILEPVYYAYALSVEQTSEPVSLKFQPLLSFIKIQIEVEDPSAISVSQIFLSNYLTKCSLNAFQEGNSIISEFNGKYSNNPLLLSLKNSIAECYMLPQNLKSNNITLSVKYMLNGIEESVDYKLSDFNDIWSVGTIYSYNIKITAEQVKISVSVEDFVDAGNVELSPQIIGNSTKYQ